MEEQKDDTVFAKQEVNNIIKDSVEAVISQSTEYQHSKVPTWVNTISENCMKRLTNLNKPFKYIVNCVIMQKNGAGFHMSNSCYWDSSSDGTITHRFENKNLYCITTVYGVSL
eukprot:gb/GECH01014154.1/.p1 GENE.gb/GECH01014154.1/~~gb/GECH01014154.1/.p1  ORF type:complete len:113 (+),score=21.03 gb/GECH01014154.1/:1-339(+)